MEPQSFYGKPRSSVEPQTFVESGEPVNMRVAAVRRNLGTSADCSVSTTCAEVVARCHSPRMLSDSQPVAQL